MLCGWVLSSIAAPPSAATASTVNSQHSNSHHRRTAVGSLLAVMVAACVWRCQARNVDWTDADTLYAAALRVCPESARINNNMGTRYEGGTDATFEVSHLFRAWVIWTYRLLLCVDWMDAGCFAVGK